MGCIIGKPFDCQVPGHKQFEMICPKCSKMHVVCKICKVGYKCCGQKISYNAFPNNIAEYQYSFSTKKFINIDAELEQKRQRQITWDAIQKSFEFERKIENEKRKIEKEKRQRRLCTECLIHGIPDGNPLGPKQRCGRCSMDHCSACDSKLYGKLDCQNCWSKRTACQKCPNRREDSYKICSSCIRDLDNCSKCGKYIPNIKIEKCETHTVSIRDEFCPFCTHLHIGKCGYKFEKYFMGRRTDSTSYCNCEAPLTRTIVDCEHETRGHMLNNYRIG